MNAAAPRGEEGWVLVPREPTDEQIKAIAHAFGSTTGEVLAILTNARESKTRAVLVEGYRAALAAAPKAPGASLTDRENESGGEGDHADADQGDRN